MTTLRYAGHTINGHEELGPVTSMEQRGSMAVVRTERGVTYICSCREPNPQQGAVEMPCDQEPA
mgnify:FL=1